MSPQERESIYSAIPDTLWASGSYDIGTLSTALPLTIKAKSSHYPSKAQYPLSREAEQGIEPVLKAFLDNGVIVPCPFSPCNSPILPVKKKDNTWRFVQDLRMVNECVLSRHSITPNPCTILADLPSNAVCFSVIDVKNAYFSIRVAPESQFWFAFLYRGQRYTFARLAQGYKESASVFNEALVSCLSTFTPPAGSTIISYVDDVLIASPSKNACWEDTLVLLNFLASVGLSR